MYTPPSSLDQSLCPYPYPPPRGVQPRLGDSRHGWTHRHTTPGLVLGGCTVKKKLKAAYSALAHNPPLEELELELEKRTTKPSQTFL